MATQLPAGAVVMGLAGPDGHIQHRGRFVMGMAVDTDKDEHIEGCRSANPDHCGSGLVSSDVDGTAAWFAKVRKNAPQNYWYAPIALGE